MTEQKGRGTWVFDLCLFQQSWAVSPPQLGFPQMRTCLRARRADTGEGRSIHATGPQSNLFPFLPVLLTACCIEGVRLGKMPGSPDNQ